MLFHVEMTVNIPHNLDKDYVNVLKAKEKEMSQALQRSGKWVDIWRVVGKFANVSIFNVESPAELHDILSNLPLFPFMDMKVTALCQHYSAIKNSDAPAVSTVHPNTQNSLQSSNNQKVMSHTRRQRARENHCQSHRPRFILHG
jgi:muconolactone D-isomerase